MEAGLSQKIINFKTHRAEEKLNMGNKNAFPMPQRLLKVVSTNGGAGQPASNVELKAPTGQINPVLPEFAIEAVKKLRDEIGLTLQRYDQSVKAGKSRKLFEIWDACLKFQDTNDMILANICQLEVMLQMFYREFMEKRARIEAELEALSGGDDELKQYSQKQAILCQQLNVFNSLLNTTTRTILLASRERRNAVYQSQFVIDVNRVQQLFAIMFSVIYKRVADPGLVREIMTDIKEYSQVLQNPVEPPR